MFPGSYRRPRITIANGPRFRPVIVDDALGAGQAGRAPSTGAGGLLIVDSRTVAVEHI